MIIYRQRVEIKRGEHVCVDYTESYISTKSLENVNKMKHPFNWMQSKKIVVIHFLFLSNTGKVTST